MSTRRSLLVTGVLTAALSVVGFVGDVAAQTLTLTVVASPIEIEEPASASFHETLQLQLLSPTKQVPLRLIDSNETVPVTLAWGGIAKRQEGGTAVDGDDYSAALMPPSQTDVNFTGSAIMAGPLRRAMRHPSRRALR